MATTLSTWIVYLLIILLHYCHYIPAHDVLHMYYIRHVTSEWNANKALHRDSRVAEKGKKQLEYLVNHFGNTIYDHMTNILSKEGNKGYEPFQFEASTLNRAQFTALAAWKSLIIKSKSKDETSTDTNENSLTNQLENAKYRIVQNLQEASWGIDAMSKFDKDWVKGIKKKKIKWMKYLARGFGKKFQKLYKKNKEKAVKNKLWKKLFSDGFDDQFCRNAQYVHGNWKTGNFLNSIWEKTQRIERYAKRLRSLMGKDVGLVIIGGHSHWFKNFVDETVRYDNKYAQKLKNRWGHEGKKVGNAHMVHVVFKAYDDPKDKTKRNTVQMISLQELFPKKGPKYSGSVASASLDALLAAL